MLDAFLLRLRKDGGKGPIEETVDPDGLVLIAQQEAVMEHPTTDMPEGAADAAASQGVIEQERARLDALGSLKVWDSQPLPGLDRLTAMVADAFDMPTVLVSMVGETEQRFVSRVGMEEPGTERGASICSVAIEQDDVFVVADLTTDPRFATNRLVCGAPGFRFYAGAPLVTPSGHAVGTLCVLDHRPRRFTDRDQQRLADFAALVLDQISLTRMVGRRDPVTGLPNRQQFYADIRSMTDAGFGGTFDLALVDVIDLPLAHRLAQALGMGPVESVIRQVAQRLEAVVQPFGTLYHVAVARFAFFLRPLPGDACERLLDEVAHAVAEPLEAEGIPLQPTCHAGFVSFGQDNAADALRRAVSATQDAIDDRATWRVYDAERDRQMRRQYRLAADVPRALRTDELHLLFQPRVDLDAGMVRGCESLLRWAHPELGELSPGEFIPIVARTALMREVTDWVLDAACRQLAVWLGEGVRLSVSVNVTAADFTLGDLPGRVVAACLAHGVPMDRLELEIVEGDWLDNSAHVIDQLQHLRERGVRIAIDDFGIGYSNFSYIYTLPFDILKIDQALVRGFLGNDRQEAVLTGVLRLCAKLGITSVAEGVETVEEDRALVAAGCQEGQGYLYAPPLTAKEMSALSVSGIASRASGKSRDRIIGLRPAP
ncbi:GGDEF and EAL domain-containing protein [Luteibacter aegosomaticola]|uniref:putative bifunctional diguanylate cyclase/phosphodiesterase n=1 Tax=Luteibacter aegosomaticola TaxID=2911538 RepID=UPI001FF9CD6F|nr:GGDEF and EAL domain-containing protein [Luteibacter aegosomaticola]UPG88278.1 GGDEF and EAL domain-containing protein [Luteibacter aegosomaticola]